MSAAFNKHNRLMAEAQESQGAFTLFRKSRCIHTLTFLAVSSLPFIAAFLQSAVSTVLCLSQCEQ